MTFDLTDEEKELILKMRLDSAIINKKKNPKPSKNNPEFSAFADEVNRLENGRRYSN